MSGCIRSKMTLARTICGVHTGPSERKGKRRQCCLLGLAAAPTFVLSTIRYSSPGRKSLALGKWYSHSSIPLKQYTKSLCQRDINHVHEVTEEPPALVAAAHLEERIDKYRDLGCTTIVCGRVDSCRSCKPGRSVVGVAQ